MKHIRKKNIDVKTSTNQSHRIKTYPNHKDPILFVLFYVFSVTALLCASHIHNNKLIAQN